MTPRPAGGGLGGLRMQRALLVASVSAVVLPLLVVITALTGFNRVEDAHQGADRTLTAQRYLQDANLMYATLHGDVLESLEDVKGSNESGGELAARTRAHVAQLRDDLLHLSKAALPPSLASDVRSLDTALRAYGSEAVRLADLASVSPRQAREQHSAFDLTFDTLAPRQATLTAELTAHAAMADMTAERRQTEAIRWTTAVAVATLSALLVVAYGLHRLGTGNESLLRRVNEDALHLAASNDELENAQQLAHIGSWQWDVGTGETRCSAEFYRILGVDPGNGGGGLEAFYERVHPEDAAAVARGQEAAATAQGEILSEYRIVRPDGNVRHVRAVGGAVRDDAGSIVRLVGTVQDVTEQRAVQRMKDEFMGLLQVRLTSLTRDEVPREGCRYAEEVSPGVQTGCGHGRSSR